jgi:uncharacterized protein
MKILLTGATGLIGSRVALRLVEENHDLVILSRHPREARKTLGLPGEYYSWADASLESVDAVINLAGESLMAKRWSEEQKKKIIDSRVQSTKKLVAAIQSASPKPKVFISASAIGFYGDRGDTVLDEYSDAGKGYLPQVCALWEREALRLREKTRVVCLRIGTVLSQDGGALEKLYLPFRAGLGGPIAGGRQWMSWIHLDDLVSVLFEALKNPQLEGPVNAVAPTPVRNQEFVRALGHALARPAVLPLPGFALKAALGEMSEVITASQRVVPAKLTAQGFGFRFHRVEDALAEIYPPWYKEGAREFVAYQWIPKKIDEVFPFFSDPKNLEKITPPWLNFRILAVSTPEIQEGTRIDYRLKIHGVSVSWQTRIDRWISNELFVDTQIKGPYRQWEHTHRFIPLKGGTFLTDRVRYKLPLGRPARFLAGNFVKNDVESIFKYRKDTISRLFLRQ